MKTFLLPENVLTATVQILGSITHSEYSHRQISEVLNAICALKEAPPPATETDHGKSLDAR